MWPFRKNEEVKITDFSDKISHVAFIMDGNGRWAKKRGLPREVGHIRGADNFRKIMDYCKKVHIRTVTVYAFSTENWKRPPEEVDGIMNLLDQFLDEELQKMAERDARVTFLGDKSPLSPKLREKAERIEKLSQNGFFQMNIALNYGGRDEILAAVNSLVAEGKPADEATFSRRLYTGASPDPDLVIRTGGEYRISNFLLWQSAYAEYYFTKTLWPDLTEEELYNALCDFCRRQRRFGGVVEDKEKTK